MFDFFVGNYVIFEMFKLGYVFYLIFFCCFIFFCYVNIMVFFFRNEEMKIEYFLKFFGVCGSQFEFVVKVINGLKVVGYNKVVVIGYCWGYKIVVLFEVGFVEVDVFISVYFM